MAYERRSGGSSCLRRDAGLPGSCPIWGVRCRDRKPKILAWSNWQCRVLLESRYGYDIYTEVVGSKATLRIGYLRQTALTLLSTEGIGHDVVDHFLVRFAEAYLNQLHDFVRRILTGSQPRVTGYDARKALAIALAASRSCRDSRTVHVSDESVAETMHTAS